MSSMKLRFPLLVLSQISTLNVWKACFSCTALVLMICLSGCGGGNTTADLAGTTPSTTDNNVTGVVGTSDSGNSINNTPLFMTPGAYVATLNNKDWISIILRTQQGSGAVSNFLSLYYNGTDPDILSGSGLITGTDTAVLSRVLLFQNTVASVRIGNGTLTKPKENSVKAELAFPATGTELAKVISLVAQMPSNYQYNLAPTLNTVQGIWQGRWSYGMGSSDNFTLNVSNQGVISSSLTFQQDCRITQGTLLPNFDGTNLFALNFFIPNATQCSFKNQMLTGAAFVTSSPVAGKTQRIFVVAISPDGRGISFKADR